MVTHSKMCFKSLSKTYKGNGDSTEYVKKLLIQGPILKQSLFFSYLFSSNEKKQKKENGCAICLTHFSLINGFIV